MIVKMMDVIRSVNVIVLSGWSCLFSEVSRSEIEYVKSMCGRYSNDVSSLFRIIDDDGMIPRVDAVESAWSFLCQIFFNHLWYINIDVNVMKNINNPVTNKLISIFGIDNGLTTNSKYTTMIRGANAANVRIVPTMNRINFCLNLSLLFMSYLLPVFLYCYCFDLFLFFFVLKLS